MPRKATKAILATLKQAGIDLGDNLDKVTEALEVIELPAEEFLSSDQVVLTKIEWREVKDDLIEKNKSNKTLKKEADDLREAMDAGDSDNVRKATSYKKKLDELEPIVAKLMDSQKDTWAAAAKTIPKELKTEFTFAEEGKELSTEQLLSNVKKFEEYKRIGALTGEEQLEGEGDKKPAGGAPKTPAGGKKPEKLSQEQMEGMTPGALVEAGYKPRPAPETTE